jgi:hypothetical protein
MTLARQRGVPPRLFLGRFIVFEIDVEGREKVSHGKGVGDRFFPRPGVKAAEKKVVGVVGRLLAFGHFRPFKPTGRG